ncbi:hypothetical protein PHYBOEH_009196 [Phytophthora boehmeriae]|uniref:Uncharacterized protein n=1 Tax=Phytophthora boehmeriae TaxID=109152 RepID=A0A8T1X6U5_9STRA|nr:hypothetical protein PHYBOEH_009196 [Phytophthora boehmeriae]
MRTFIPADIADLTVEGLIARAREDPDGSGSGTLYTYDLATYLKTNRFLHWLVMHGDDIERANFLAVESASFFTDFTSYDINELQALVRVIPDSFAFDKDGRKRAWRTSFIEHVRMLSAQHQHETIKAGWDPIKRARRDVPLPKLTARQQLNTIYCYPTDAEIDARLEKFERQRSRLESKRLRLQKLDDELIPQAKAEYLAVAEDARNEDMQRAFGKTTLNALRDEAKQQHLSLCKERDAAKSELVHGERAWDAMSPSFEQYQAEIAQIRALDPEIRNAPRIRGPFPSNIDLQPRERAAFKKLSVEEEAEARKQELDNAIAKRGLDISDVAMSEEVTVVESAPETAVAANGLAVGSSLSAEEVATARLMQLEDKLCANAVKDTLSNLTKDIPTASPQRGFQRVKSLQVAVGVLSFLEKDFCSPKRVQRGKEGGLMSPSQKLSASLSEQLAESPSSRADGLANPYRRSQSTPSTPRGDLKSTQDEEAKDAKVAPISTQPKSKALLKLLEARRAEEAGTSTKSTEPSVAVRPSPFGGGVNFLNELQGRFNRKGSNAEVTASGDNREVDGGSVGAKKPMNFLDELKRTSARKSTNIHDHIGVEDTSQPQVLESLISSRNNSTAPPVPWSFLDELKARTASK